MADIFISYSRTDQAFVKALTSWFAGQEREFWIDWEGVPKSADWWQEIREGIEASDNFVFIVSKHSATSAVCHLELAHAISLNKRIIPVLFEKPDESQIFEQLRQLQLTDLLQSMLGDRDLLVVAHNNWRVIAGLDWIFFEAQKARDRAYFSSAYKLLADTIDTDLVYKKMHSRLVVRAEEWERSEYDPSFLLQGKDLQDAERWLEIARQAYPQPTEKQKNYIAESRKRQKVIRRRLLLGIGVALLAVIVLIGLSMTFLRQAEESDRIALSRELAALSQTQLADNLELSLLSAVEAYNTDKTNEAVDSLITAVQSKPAVYRYLRLHDKNVMSMSFSSDGTLLASGDTDGMVYIWDWEQGIPVAGIKMDVGIIALQFADSDQRLWMLDGLQGLFRLDLESGDLETIKPTDINQKLITRGTFSTDGTLVAGTADPMGNPNGDIFVWERESGLQLYHYPIPSDSLGVEELAITPDNRYLVWSFTGVPSVFLWDLTLDEFDWIEETSSTPALAVSADGKGAWTNMVDETIGLMVYDYREDEFRTEPIKLPNVGDGEVAQIAFLANDIDIAVGTLDGDLAVYDSNEGTPVLPFTRGHSDRMAFVAASPVGDIVATADDTGTIIIWHTKEPSYGRLVLETPPTSLKTRSAAFDPSGTALAISDGQAVQLWSTGDLFGELKPQNNSEVLEMAFDGSGEKLVILFEDQPSIEIWEPAGGGLTLSHTFGGSEIAEFAISPDGRWLATRDYGDILQIWDTSRGQMVVDEVLEQELPGGLLIPPAVTYSHDGRMLAVGGGNDGIYTYSVKDDGSIGDRERLTTFEKGRLPESPGSVTAVSFSHDDTMLAAGLVDGTVIGWKLPEEKFWTAREHGLMITSLDFSTDDSFVISASDDDSARLWLADSGVQIGPPMRFNGDMEQVNVRADSQLVTVEFSENGMREWPLNTTIWQRDACMRANLVLSEEEWSRVYGDTPFHITCPMTALVRAKVLADRGDGDGAADLATKSVPSAMLAPDSNLKEASCLQGVLTGFSEVVSPICEALVEQEPDGRYHYGRAAQRAFMGDLEGAGEDVNTHIEWAKNAGLPGEALALRQGWQTALANGSNPFNQETLAQARLDTVGDAAYPLVVFELWDGRASSQTVSEPPPVRDYYPLSAAEIGDRVEQAALPFEPVIDLALLNSIPHYYIGNIVAIEANQIEDETIRNDLIPGDIALAFLLLRVADDSRAIAVFESIGPHRDVRDWIAAGAGSLFMPLIEFEEYRGVEIASLSMEGVDQIWFIDDGLHVQITDDSDDLSVPLEDALLLSRAIIDFRRDS